MAAADTKREPIDPAVLAKNHRYWPFAREFAQALTEDAKTAPPFDLPHTFLTIYEHQFAEALSLLTVAIGDDYRTGKLSDQTVLKITEFLDHNQLRVR